MRSPRRRASHEAMLLLASAKSTARRRMDCALGSRLTPGTNSLACVLPRSATSAAMISACSPLPRNAGRLRPGPLRWRVSRLTFHWPSIRSIGISTPMMAFIGEATIGGGGIVDRPGPWACAILKTCQVINAGDGVQVASSITARAAPGVHGDIIPRRHDFFGFAFGRIPRWTDVFLGPWNTIRHCSTVQLAPLRIGAREMAAQRARADPRVDQERNRIACSPLGPAGSAGRADACE